MRTFAWTCGLAICLLSGGCASRTAIVVQPQGPRAIAPKAWHGPEEERLAAAVREAPTPAAQLAALDNWEAAFPGSDFADVRLEWRIGISQQQQRWRDTFDASRKLLQIDPFRLRGLMGIAISVQRSAPTDDELQFAAEACRRIVDSPEVVYSHGDSARPPMANLGLTTLGWIEMQRKDYAQAILDLYSLLALDPTQAYASYQLGAALLAQREDPRAQRTALFHFARAAVYDGPNALPAEQRKVALEYVTRIWRQYFGTTEGFDALAAIAKTSAFPSGEFR